ncbi:MAG: Rieske 2Fe-2S domain-containing protein [Melioribacteraceae bacterium]|nr:Rieske 2Fe-2S domain-containing protein [Melioribacteraceae bacterium]MCF8264145.1 Rieske 2Fe-2S domain-containing protein [Melioribacteraceae bacterium]MCF8413802.1 Rieske 2Fe-2S domain-containing protein [Melioribacteraceae bacterium]MCF8430769.1 Rieske 2Fe-2S domain-containing protein [Melioribacteraceae bacterium]
MSVNKPNSRREFINKFSKGIGAIAIGTYSISVFNSCAEDSNPVSSDNNTGNSGNSGELTVDISQSANVSLATVGGTLALSSNIIDSSGLLLHRVSESAVTVLSRKCTHQGCTIGAFSNSVSRCGCHGSQFSLTGSVVNGPASSSLKKYTAILTGNIIKISA